MWIITKRRLQQYWEEHQDTEGWLENWHKVTRWAKWKNLQDVRKSFPQADSVRVASGKSATVFNVRGNNHRMITAIHYNTGKIYVMAVMPHAEYSKDKWKETL